MSGPGGLSGAGGIGGMPDGHDPGMMSPEMMMYQPEGTGDLDPGLPGSQDPLRIGGVRRPGMPGQMPGMFGPGG